MKADAFSIGFGREIVGWTDKRGTRWKVGWLPLGGYVKFAGDMNPARRRADEWLSLPAEERAETFQAEAGVAALPDRRGRAGHQLPVRDRRLHDHLRDRRLSRPRRRSAHRQPGSAAAGAPGFRPGDRIVALDGSRHRDLRRPVSLCRAAARGDDGCSRSGAAARTVEIPSDPRRDQRGPTSSATEPGSAVLGIAPAAPLEFASLPLHQLPGAAVGHRAGPSLDRWWTALGQVITGRRSLQELGGPLKIARGLRPAGEPRLAALLLADDRRFN